MTRPISHRRASTSIAVICALALVPLAPLRAADEKSDEPSKSEKLVTQMGALSTAIEGLREKGADTVKEHGGELEGALLSSFAIKAAAAQIRKENTGTGYLVASPSDAIASDRWLMFDAQIRGLCIRLTENDTCSVVAAVAGRRPLVDRDEAGALPLLSAITTILPILSSVLRSETEVSALGGELSDSKLLARAVAQDSTATSSFTLLAPPRLTDIARSEPYLALQRLIAARNKIAAANAKPKNEAVAASIKTADEFVALNLTADAAGNVPLLDVIRAKAMLAKLGKRPLLIVSIEKAGGTLLTRKGIDVALGAPSVRASGGVIISYTVASSDPANFGEISKTGFLACTTRLTELKRIHKLKADDFKGQCS